MNNFQQKNSWWTLPHFVLTKCHEQLVFFFFMYGLLKLNGPHRWREGYAQTFDCIRALTSMVSSINLDLPPWIKTRPLTFLNPDLWGPAWQTRRRKRTCTPTLRASGSQEKFWFVEPGAPTSWASTGGPASGAGLWLCPSHQHTCTKMVRAKLGIH